MTDPPPSSPDNTMDTSIHSDHPIDFSIRSDSSSHRNHHHSKNTRTSSTGIQSDYGNNSSIDDERPIPDVSTESSYISSLAPSQIGASYDESSVYDDSDFPPGHITTLDQMEVHQTRRKSSSGISPHTEDEINPSILPTYFFCPLTRCIMNDPVMTPDGNTYERLALLRYLIISETDPLSGNRLSHEQFKEDRLVKKRIEKSRKEAWIRYMIKQRNDCKVMESDDDDSPHYESEEDSEVDCETDEGYPTDDGHNSYASSDESEDLVLVNTSSSDLPSKLMNENLLKSNFEGIIRDNNSSNNNSSSSNFKQSNNFRSDASETSTPTPSNIHGWNTPLGVHQIICNPPGLLVTTDFHRRSAVVSRKFLVKKLKPRKSGRKRHKFSTMVCSRDLILEPGTHVEILETVVHGGRVRGNIVWEEEMIVEFDEMTKRKLLQDGDLQFPHVANGNGKKKKSFFRGKNSSNKSKNPFSSDLFAESPHREIAAKTLSPSPPPLTTVKYGGWISLEWAGNNRERTEAASRRKQRGAAAAANSIADEDDGPWSQPLPLGVYRIQGASQTKTRGRESYQLAQLPLSDSPDNDRNITHVLLEKQCVEIVETQVVIMKTKLSNNQHDNPNHLLRMYESDGNDICGIRTVRARCLVPILIPPMVPEHLDGRRCVNARSQKKFKSGWISLCTDNNTDAKNASPLPSGAYTIVSHEGCAVTEGQSGDSKVKSILPWNSCVEVVTTRMEFVEKEERMTCQCCGRDNMYSVVAVRALIASGGHLTLFVFPIGSTSLSGSTFENYCSCGKLVQHTIAEPVPLGLYEITHPNGVLVTMGLRKESQTISSLGRGDHVEVLQTGVEDGCVRGRICVSDEDNSTNDSVTGWINLFEFPERRWAEYVDGSVKK